MNILQNKKTDGQYKLRCGEKLKAMKGDLTARNKVDALAKFKLSRPTLDKYLNGNVAKLDTGIDLLLFFAGKIEEANEALVN